jgi:PAS domain S-box-containing protein
MQDISERHYNEQMLSLERSIFELSTHSAVPFNKVLNTLLEGIEKLHPDAYTSILKLREDGSVEQIASPRIPKAFKQAIDGAKIGDKDGTCGAAMFHKKGFIVEDIETHPLWINYKGLMNQFGLRSSWSLPIINSSGKVVGCFATYHKMVKKPTTKELNTVERVRNIIRVLMENNMSLREIKTTNERFDAVMKATHDLIWDWNLENNIIYRDPNGLQKVYGLKENKGIENIYDWIKHIHPEDQDRVLQTINDILQATHQDTFEVEYRFMKDDETYTYVYDRGKIIRNSAGKPIRMLGAAQDITERKRLEHILIHQELERQKAINQATVETQEQERGEIGKELHDNVNQVLTTTKLYLELASSNAELKDELINKSTKNIVNVINEIRQLSRSLMDPSIGDLGLVDSIHDLVGNINLTRKLHVTLVVDDSIDPLLSKNQKLTTFRIIQEALNNAIRHAKATTVNIDISKKEDAIEMMIKDDGIGFNPQTIKKGAGLKNIQNRVYLIDGTHSIESQPEQGCTLIINFPIHQNL